MIKICILCIIVHNDFRDITHGAVHGHLIKDAVAYYVGEAVAQIG